MTQRVGLIASKRAVAQAHQRFDVDDPLRQNADLALQVQLSKALLDLSPQDGIGTALSYLLMMSMKHPEMLRRVLNEKVVKEGFRGVSMLDTLNRIGR